MLQRDLIGQELISWRLEYGYIMEIDRGPAGFFPAVVAKSEWVVVCLELTQLKRVWEKMPRREVRIIGALFLFIEGTAIPMDRLDGYGSNSRHFFCVSRNYLLDAYLKERGFFKWANDNDIMADNDVAFPKEQNILGLLHSAP